MIKNILKSNIILSFIILMLVGCTSKNEVISKESAKVQTTKQHLEVAADMQKNVTSQDTLESTIASLSAQMLENKNLIQINQF